MENILEDISKILNFNDSFFGEVEKLGKMGFYETDLDSGTFRASANYRRLFKLPKRNIYGVEEFQDLIHPEDFVWVTEAYNTCLKEGRNFEGEYRVFVKGKLRYFRGKSVFVLNEKGEAVKVVGMKQDITDEKLAEIEKMKYIKKLQHAHELTTTVVHDLKAPMHNISMIAELLKGGVEGGQESLIEMLERSCQRSYEIIDDVLESSSREGDENHISKECYNIHKLLDKAVSTLYYTAQKKGIKILTSLQPGIYAFVHPKKLQRAMENLLSNAVKFSHRDSQIEVSLYEMGKFFVIKIEDFGLGMDELQKALLFHNDNPLRKEGTGGEKSSGLGMNIVKKIIHQHGGRIEVESRESVGTTFYIELPKE